MDCDCYIWIFIIGLKFVTQTFRASVYMEGALAFLDMVLPSWGNLLPTCLRHPSKQAFRQVSRQALLGAS